MPIGSPVQTRGFTLIEMSIVLVIIGLIIGGILVGRDLISASEVRAQIAQIEKYNSAVNTFRNKYGGLPGDLGVTLATQFGFTTTGCDGTAAKRDGNGLIDGYPGVIYTELIGETVLFWADLSTVNLIESTFPNGGGAAEACGADNAGVLTMSPGANYIGDYFPSGKIGYGTFVYVYETGGTNWFSVSGITHIGVGGSFNNSSGTIPVVIAYNIDKKVDDGLPTTGTIVANFINNNALVTPTTAPADNTSTCYNTTSYTYSISASANGGTYENCALSFRFQ